MKKEELGRNATAPVIPAFDFGIASRFHFFSRVLDRVHSVEGDVVECGVGWGRSLLYILTLLKLSPVPRKMWAFDSFEGFPEPSPEDNSPRNPKKGEWKSDMGMIYQMLLDAGLKEDFLQERLTAVKGFFDKSLPGAPIDKIAFLHVDVDLYQSYLDVLNELYDKVSPGGIIVFDEYKNPRELEKFPGASRAIDEFFRGKEKILKDEIYGKFYVVKQ